MRARFMGGRLADELGAGSRPALCRVVRPVSTCDKVALPGRFGQRGPRPRGDRGFCVPQSAICLTTRPQRADRYVLTCAMKRVALALAVALVLAWLPPAHAASGRVKVLTYNIAGLPDGFSTPHP